MLQVQALKETVREHRTLWYQRDCISCHENLSNSRGISKKYWEKMKLPL
jgi:hypothetical protein